MSEKKYVENMLLYGAKHQPTLDEKLMHVAKVSIKEPWPKSDDDIEFHKWLREQWMYSLMLYEPGEVYKLVSRFPVLNEFAFLTDVKKVDEFRNHVNLNLKFPDSMQQFPLSVEHASDHRFVENTIKHFFDEGMAELVLDNWEDVISTTEKCTLSVARFVMFRGVIAKCQMSSSIVASEMKLARLMCKHDIDIDMSASELREFCKTDVARKLFWLIVGMYVIFDKSFDRSDHEAWGIWFEKAMHMCTNDEDVKKLREYAIDCENRCVRYCELLQEKMGSIDRLLVGLNVIIWKEDRAINALEIEYEAKQGANDYSAAGKINGAINDHKHFRNSAHEMRNTKLIIQFLNGVYVPPQTTLGTSDLARIQDIKALDLSLTKKLDDVELFIGTGNMIMKDLLTIGEIMESADMKEACQLQAKKNEEEEQRRRELIAQNGHSLNSREAALAFIASQCASVSSSTPTPDFMFGVPAPGDPRSVLDQFNQGGGADLSDLLGEEEAMPFSFTQAVVNVDAVNAAVAFTVEKMVRAIEKTEKDREINEKIEAAVGSAVEAALECVCGEIRDAYTAERIQYRRSVRNVLKTFNKVKNSIVQEIHSMRIGFGVYIHRVEQQHKKGDMLNLVSEIRCIEVEVSHEVDVCNAMVLIATKDKKEMFTLAAYRIFPDCMLKEILCDQCGSHVDMSLNTGFNPRNEKFTCYCCILTNHSERLQLEYQTTRLIKSVRGVLNVSEFGFDLQDSANPLTLFPFDYTKRVFLATAPLFVPLAMHSDEVQCSFCLDQLDWGVDKGIGFVTCCPEFGFLCGRCIGNPKAHNKEHQTFAADYMIARVMAEVRSKVGI